jgi:ribosomal protein RSM22 (predicted rRNA methylase)
MELPLNLNIKEELHTIKQKITSSAFAIAANPNFVEEIHVLKKLLDDIIRSSKKSSQEIYKAIKKDLLLKMREQRDAESTAKSFFDTELPSRVKTLPYLDPVLKTKMIDDLETCSKNEMARQKETGERQNEWDRSINVVTKKKGKEL